MTEPVKIGEVIEACSTYYVAQCYELYQTPALGSLVITKESNLDLFGLVCQVSTSGIEPGRRPIARGKDETHEEDIYRANPQLFKLLKSEFNVLVVGFRRDHQVFQYLPPHPAHLHSFVIPATIDEITRFSRSFNFLNLILKSRLELPLEELVGASLRQMAVVYGEGRHSFLVSAGRELAGLLSGDYAQLKAILKGLKNDAA
jgi:hypothetical protein